MNETKTWREMLNESLKDPNFRKEWEDANAELAELDRIIAARSEMGLTQADSICSGIRNASANFVGSESCERSQPCQLAMARQRKALT